MRYAGDGGEESFELLAVAVFAAGNIDIFPDDRPILRGGELTELDELVLSVLRVGRDPAIKSNSHEFNIRRGVRF
jgi:hypothetical protein